MQKAGNIASKNGNLWRAFDAIQKQSCKIRGGGYAIATLYYKECPTRNIKGIISGSALEADDKALLIDVFCKVAKSSKNKENEQKEDEQKGEKQSSVLNKSVAPSRNDDESKRPQVKLTEDVEVKYIIEEDPLVIKEEPYATEEELLVIEAEPFVIKEEPFVIKEEPHVIKEEPI
ncbi:uncharacterized protein [Cherax quadricarinatus]|nr:uncharacterized protein LOC128698913 [Cherax quadricarinatus]